MSEKVRFIFASFFWMLFFALIGGQHIAAQDLFSTSFNNLNNWGGGAPTSYNEKFYAEGGWYFHSTEAVRGNVDESFGGSLYSFRDRAVFTVYNTQAVSGMSGFSMQLRDWMLGSGENRNLKVSYNGGASWETVAVINKSWFSAYQVYQEFIYFFPGGPMSFNAEDFMIELDGGGSSNNGRINIGQFIAMGEATQVATPAFNPPGGLYFDAIEVSITTLTDGAVIFYTLDGSEPTENDPIYTQPIPIDHNTTIKARAFKAGLDASNVATAQYEFRTLLLTKDFEDDDIFSGGWSIHDYIPGANTWLIKTFGGVKFAEITEFQSNPQYPHSWYISPAINISGLEDVMLTFESLTAFRTGDALSVHISTNYNGAGDPANASWTELPAQFDPHLGGGYGNWTHSGDIGLSDYSGFVHIAFKYESDVNNLGTWQINNVFISAEYETGPSNDASLASFKLGSLNVLNLGGIVVSDPVNDAGAILYLDDVDNLQGIEVVTAHTNASFTVTVNGNLLDETELDDHEINFNDVIIVTVVAENEITTQYYKVTVTPEARVLTILTPQEGDEFFTYDEVAFSWEAENIDQLILQLFVQGFADPFLTEIVNAAEGQHIETVPNGLHFDFYYRLTDYYDHGFYVESGVFSYIDNVNPSLVNKYPEAGSIDISVDASLFLEFDEFLINLGAGSFHIYKQQNDELVESILADGPQVDFVFNKVYVNLAENLEPATTYYVLIDDNAVKDMADNYYAGIDDPSYWTFTTKDEDTPGDLICNGDFENWTDGLPDCWYGEKSNIPASNVVQYADNPQSGSYAVKLINDTGSHQRFTSQATQVVNGVTYNITFWIKGQGEIRTGLFDDRETGYGYAPYNQYIQVNADTWTEHTQIVTAATSSSIAEFIFSIRNTGSALNHLQIDNVSIKVDTDDPQEVATIADLRNGQIGNVYKLSGEAVITYQQDYRNQKFIQDHTAAIMIDDQSGIITSQYNRYDGITGLSGTLGIYNQMLQFIPIADPGAPTSTGNIVNPEVVTLGALGSAHQARLVQVWNATFEDSGNFATGQNYTLNSPGGTGVFRTSFFDADYIGTAIPSQPQIITAIVQQFMETMQITARGLDDFELFTDIHDHEIDGINIYPNPFSDRIHVSNAGNIANITLQNSIGQVIMSVTPSPGLVSIPATQLKPGVYFMKINLNDGNILINKIIKQ